MTPGVGRALFAAVGVLDGLRLPYAVVGGLAVGAWGVNRSTRDADLYADLPESVRPALQRALEGAGFHVPAMAEELEQFGVFRSRSADGVFVDIFSSVGPLGQAILDRRKRVELEGHPLWIISPEDLALLKAFSDRERDFEDLVNLTAVVGSKLDVDYVRRWAKQLDVSIGGDEVSERVDRAIAEATRTGAPQRRKRAKTRKGPRT
jgi:hypothetical protein